MVSHCIEEGAVFIDDDQLNPIPDEEEKKGKPQHVIIGAKKAHDKERNHHCIKDVFGEGFQTEDPGGEPFVELPGIQVFRL